MIAASHRSGYLRGHRRMVTRPAEAGGDGRPGLPLGPGFGGPGQQVVGRRLEARGRSGAWRGSSGTRELGGNRWCTKVQKPPTRRTLHSAGRQSSAAPGSTTAGRSATIPRPARGARRAAPPRADRDRPWVAGVAALLTSASPSIRFQQVLPAHPELEELDLRRVDRGVVVPPTWTEALLDLGFAEPVLLRIPEPAPNVTAYLILVVNRATGDKAMATALIGTWADPDPDVVRRVQHPVRRRDGVRHAELGRVERLPIGPADGPQARPLTVQDPAELYALHRYVMETRPADGSPWVFPPGEAVEYLLEYAFGQSYEEQARRGILYYDRRADSYRPTLYGAYRMTWGLAAAVQATPGGGDAPPRAAVVGRVGRRPGLARYVDERSSGPRRPTLRASRRAAGRTRRHHRCASPGSGVTIAGVGSTRAEGGRRCALLHYLGVAALVAWAVLVAVVLGKAARVRLGRPVPGGRGVAAAGLVLGGRRNSVGLR